MSTSFLAGYKGRPWPGTNSDNLEPVLQHAVLLRPWIPLPTYFLCLLPGPALGSYFLALRGQDHASGSSSLRLGQWPGSPLFPRPSPLCFKASLAWASCPRATMLPRMPVNRALLYTNKAAPAHPSSPPPGKLGLQVARGCDGCHIPLGQEGAVHSWVKRPHRLSAVTFVGPSESEVTLYPVCSSRRGLWP